MTLPNGVATAHTYEADDRLLALATAKGASVLAKFTYSLDPVGNRTGITYADGSKSLYTFDHAIPTYRWIASSTISARASARSAYSERR